MTTSRPRPVVQFAFVEEDEDGPPCLGVSREGAGHALFDLRRQPVAGEEKPGQGPRREFGPLAGRRLPQQPERHGPAAQLVGTDRLGREHGHDGRHQLRGPQAEERLRLRLELLRLGHHLPNCVLLHHCPFVVVRNDSLRLESTVLRSDSLRKPVTIGPDG